MVDWAKRHNRFIPKEEIAKFESALGLGWKEVKGAPQHLVYEHTQTKILMHDAHPGNFIETKNCQLVPIDVFFEGL